MGLPQKAQQPKSSSSAVRGNTKKELGRYGPGRHQPVSLPQRQGRYDRARWGGESLGETDEATDMSQEWVGLGVRRGQEMQALNRQGRDESCR